MAGKPFLSKTKSNFGSSSVDSTDITPPNRQFKSKMRKRHLITPPDPLRLANRMESRLIKLENNQSEFPP
jgi:hypothetical protein